MSDKLEKVIKSRPIDATAARVVAAGPKGYESAKVILTVCQPEPPQMRRLPPGTPNLIGVRSGHLVVVGLSARVGGRGGNAARWVCRCVCGYYTERTSKSVRRGNQRPATTKQDATDKCDRCRQVTYLRRSSEYRQLGYHPDEDPMTDIKQLSAGADE